MQPSFGLVMQQRVPPGIALRGKPYRRLRRDTHNSTPFCHRLVLREKAWCERRVLLLRFLGCRTTRPSTSPSANSVTYATRNHLREINRIKLRIVTRLTISFYTHSLFLHEEYSLRNSLLAQSSPSPPPSWQSHKTPLKSFTQQPTLLFNICLLLS